MPSDISSYLATHYLTADPKPSSGKKRKRNKNADSSSSGLIIADEDATGWKTGGGDDDDDEGFGAGGIGSATVAGTSAEFRKAKKSAWKTLGGGDASLSTTTSKATQQQDSSEADAIVASAAKEAASTADNDNEDEDNPAVTMMSDGTYAGLQSAASVTAQLEKRKAKERAEFDKLRKTHKEAETVYRDATGRRVDVEWKRAEARREMQAAKDKEVAAQQALRGEVQEEERRLRREKLDDAKLMTVARHVDDEEMNREMKEKTRWGDTMAQFIEPKTTAGTGAGGGKGSSGAAGGSKRIKGRPVYQGAWAPNRYGIRPGYRWDGVDRSNGFEAERFKAINRRERNKGLEYSWQMDE